jgi:hypothetical protein
MSADQKIRRWVSAAGIAGSDIEDGQDTPDLLAAQIVTAGEIHGTCGRFKGCG